MFRENKVMFIKVIGTRDQVYFVNPAFVVWFLESSTGVEFHLHNGTVIYSKISLADWQNEIDKFLQNKK
jgi:hypothetical protein